eukprot:jgi/Mesvir1/6869/Mv09038-RA.1
MPGTPAASPRLRTNPLYGENAVSYEESMEVDLLRAARGDPGGAEGTDEYVDSSGVVQTHDNRDRWGSHLMFLIASIGAAIGLGNIWRYPYLVFKFGGGAFLIPYLFALFCVGLPLLLLELALGQQMQKGSVDALRMIDARAWGTGLAGALASLVIVAYYNIIMAWCWLYLIKSFQSPLPWAGNGELSGVDAATKFFTEEILNSSGSIGNLGGIQGQVFWALVITWVLVYFCVWKGVDSTGPAAMISLPLPFLIIGILFFRGMTLDGAGQGLKFYLKPEFGDLWNGQVWINAMSQIFFSLSLASGIMIAYGSFNGKHTNVVKDSAIIGISNSAFSIFGGFVVFSVLGYLAHEEGVEVRDVVKSGPGLAFIAFPSALALMPWAPFFSVIFFVMLLILALDSSFSMVEAVNTVLYDRVQWCHDHKQLSTALVCLVGFLGGIIMTTGAGEYYLDLLDHYVSDYILILLGLLEVLFVGWAYDADKLAGEILMSTGKPVPRIWIILIKYVDPVIIAILFLYNLGHEFAHLYGGYPFWAIFIGWLVVLAVMAFPVLSWYRPYLIEAGVAGEMGPPRQDAVEPGQSHFSRDHEEGPLDTKDVVIEPKVTTSSDVDAAGVPVHRGTPTQRATFQIG